MSCTVIIVAAVTILQTNLKNLCPTMKMMDIILIVTRTKMVTTMGFPTSVLTVFISHPQVKVRQQQQTTTVMMVKLYSWILDLRIPMQQPDEMLLKTQLTTKYALSVRQSYELMVCQTTTKTSTAKFKMICVTQSVSWLTSDIGGEQLMRLILHLLLFGTHQDSEYI